MKVLKIGKYEYAKATAFNKSYWVYRDPYLNSGRGVVAAGEQISAMLDVIDKMMGKANGFISGAGAEIVDVDD